MRNPAQIASAILRNLATLCTLTAERIDPQPDHTIHTFNIHGPNGTTGCEAHITWHKTC